MPEPCVQLTKQHRRSSSSSGNLNTDDDGSKLIVVNSFAQQLYTIDPDTGVADLVDLGGGLLPGAGGDGLVSCTMCRTCEQRKVVYVV